MRPVAFTRAFIARTRRGHASRPRGYSRTRMASGLHDRRAPGRPAPSDAAASAERIPRPVTAVTRKAHPRLYETLRPLGRRAYGCAMTREKAALTRRRGGRPAASPAVAAPAHPVLALQRSIGNAAVTRLLQRAPAARATENPTRTGKRIKGK